MVILIGIIWELLSLGIIILFFLAILILDTGRYIFTKLGVKRLNEKI